MSGGDYAWAMGTTLWRWGPYGEKFCGGCDDNTEKRERRTGPPPPPSARNGASLADFFIAVVF